MDKSREEYERVKALNAKLKARPICIMCKTRRVQQTFLPCRHLVTCSECANKIENCALCDKPIMGTVTTYWV